MGKKRKASAGGAAPEKKNGFDAKSKMRAYTSYEDLADSEDEFHINRDKVMLEDAPDVKRRKKWQAEDAELEPSDEEVLAYSESDEDEDEAPAQVDDDSDNEKIEEEDEDAEGWGTSRKDYYNNDEIQTEADALEEEAEARRLQKKKLAKMTDADFGLDDLSGWGDSKAGAGKGDDGEKGDVVTEVLERARITPGMTGDEIRKMMQPVYPEYDFISDELVANVPVLEDLKAQLKSEEATGQKLSSKISVTLLKVRALVAYISTMCMYFALLSSQDDGPMDADELHEHPVMEHLVKTRELWEKASKITARPLVLESESKSDIESDISSEDEVIEARSTKKSRKEQAHLDAVEEAGAQRRRQIKDAEASFADLSGLLPKKKASKKTKVIMPIQDDDSDFGEEESMDAKSAAEKAQKKKSLRFYTSQIAQKANKRAGAGRDAGGDEDLPHRERMRDRQTRLNAEAEKRGKKLDEYGRGAAGTALGGDNDSGDEAVAAEVREDGDEYYDMVTKVSKQKKADKQDRLDAIKQAKAEGGLVRVVEGEVDEDGKRAIGYVIEKNKGLAPKRKKDVRNPRVKKKKKYEEKMKKLASTKAVYKGGEERGGYGGEKTGIKTGLVKSIKL